MKLRYLATGLLIAGGIVLFLIGSARKRSSNASPTLATGLPESVPQTVAPAEIEEVQRASFEKTGMTNNPLAAAYQMAAFIEQVLASEPPERYSTRSHLRGIQTIFFVSDYVMAAKTNSTLALSESAIIAAFTNVTQDTSFIKERLQHWAVRSGTLSDHYQDISEIPTEKENISAIKSALIENGVAIDTESDLLMDCLRYVAHNTGIHEAYGPKPRRIQEATPFPPALEPLIETGDLVFRQRFIEKFGMSPPAVTNVMNRIKDLRIYGLSPADVQIPVARRFQ